MKKATRPDPTGQGHCLLCGHRLNRHLIDRRAVKCALGSKQKTDHLCFAPHCQCPKTSPRTALRNFRAERQAVTAPAPASVPDTDVDAPLVEEATP